MPTPGRRIVVECGITAAAVLLLVWAARADVAWFEAHVLTARCVTHAMQPALVTFGRVAAGATALALLAIARPRLGRRAARARPGSLGMIAGAILASVACAAGVTEIALRRGHADPPLQPHPRYGWIPAPGETSRYRIDALGRRIGDQPIDPARPSIVIAGESFGFGFELDHADTLAARLARDTGLQVVNVSAPAYGNDQAYLRLIDELPRLEHPVAVVFLVVDEQLGRNTRADHPHFVLDGERLSLAPPATGLAAWHIAGLWPVHDDGAVRVTAAIVRAADQAIRARGARPIFLVTGYGWPCLQGSPYPAIFGALPHVTVDLGRDERIGGRDGHPNARGAARLANSIERSIE